MSNYLQDLNNDQRKAVEQTEGSSMVIVAGSGKTRVLTYKIVHLLKNGVNPFNILGSYLYKQGVKGDERKN